MATGPLVRNGVYDAENCGLPVCPVYRAGEGYFGQRYRFTLAQSGPSSLPAYALDAVGANVSQDADGDDVVSITTPAKAQIALPVSEGPAASWSSRADSARYCNGDCSVPTALSRFGNARGSFGCPVSSSSSSEGDDELEWTSEARAWLSTVGVHQPYWGSSVPASCLGDVSSGWRAWVSGLGIPEGTWFLVVEGVLQSEASSKRSVRVLSRWVTVYVDGELVRPKQRWDFTYYTYFHIHDINSGFCGVFLGGRQHRVHAGMTFSYWASAVADVEESGADSVRAFLSGISIQLGVDGPVD